MRIIRVVIGDDDRAFREAVSDVLTDDPRFAVVAAVATGAELRTVASETRPDVALVDIRMPGGGAAAVRGLIEDARAAAAARDLARVPIAVIAVSAHSGAHDVRAVVAAGASGYLAKGTLGATLPDLVFRCASGEVILAVPTGATALTALVAANEEVDSHH
ncbi:MULTISPECIES: response regulator [unclassified Nocardioides]|uniref:response regulator n=1 Tax=unclassified Nocardioides TaxID=2615069 RepID=UPI0009EF885F|nr:MULTISPECIES: response regulator transcription factor [unclassified Nocardioides]GAW50389.1 LuxR family transcriptional regulator [Nocardioides sp. PD653-B2]GAW53111.1 LuxR family transcriptional regulator [Nocardioides sp. PD653]